MTTIDTNPESNPDYAGWTLRYDHQKEWWVARRNFDGCVIEGPTTGSIVGDARAFANALKQANR